MDLQPNTTQPGGMRRAGWRGFFGKAGRDIEGIILGAPAEGTRGYVRGHPEGDSVSGQAGKGEATPVALPFPFLRFTMWRRARQAGRLNSRGADGRFPVAIWRNGANLPP